MEYFIFVSDNFHKYTYLGSKFVANEETVFNLDSPNHIRVEHHGLGLLLTAHLALKLDLLLLLLVHNTIYSWIQSR